MDELLILVPAVIGMAGAVTTGQWWFEAHTRWLARLSARSLIESHVEPWEPPRRLIDNLNPRWVSRQRIAGHDLAKLFSDLRHTPDEDRTTEMWRVRALRRSRLTLWVGLAWLASTGLYPAAYGVAGWTGVVVVSALLLVAYVVWGRKLYARLRSWGEYDNIPAE
jgi:hypothetical protein